MKVHLESTTKIVDVNGVPARVWQGNTDSGIEVTVLVTRIAVDAEENCGDFERELQEHCAPRAQAAAFPLRMVL